MTNVIFGFLSAVGGPLLPPIIIEFLGEHNLAVGYGILLIFEGVGSFAGPPLAGIVYIYTLILFLRFSILFLFFNKRKLVTSDRIIHVTKENILMNQFFFSGLLYSLSESYTSAFYLSSALFFMAGAVMSLPILKFHKPEDMYSRSTSTMTTQTFDE